ncbi:hypothetical protein [Paenibacillus thermotolerans]|uniref:hypothetical protein n=1 Tax=Paenibacillus thermotolerans TaxID=3027807 RepID=UPI002367AF4F|nr:MULTISPECIES: hypothetical protein [unclassified Paenibacillus]
MIGSILWNAAAAVAGAALIFLLSYGHNPPATSGMRALYSFVIVFAVTFAVRWLLALALTGGAGPNATSPSPPETDGAAEDDKGQSIDFTTPDDDKDFSPLNPPKLKTVRGLEDPEELAKAIRHMSEQ